MKYERKRNAAGPPGVDRGGGFFYDSSMEKKISFRRWLWVHLALAGGLGALLVLFGCPLYRFTGLPCPLCGMTRAWLAALRLDFSAAFFFHPLFPLAPPALLYAAHREVLPRRLPPRADRLCAAALGTALAAVYLYRLFWQQPSAITPCWEGSLLAWLLSFAGAVPA